MTKYNEIPKIKSAVVVDEDLYVLFENGDIKKLSINTFKELGININTKEFSNIYVSPFSVVWKKLNYEVGHDSIFDLGQTVNLSPVSVILLRKSQNISRRKLAQKLNVSESEISQLESGKKTNLKLLQKIFSTLL